MAPRPGDRQLIKEWNEGLVLEMIRRHGPLTRIEIADRTGLGRSTITVISARLIRQGLILEGESVNSGDAGRRPVLLCLQSRARAAVGLKLGPAGITAAALDLNAEIAASLDRPLPGDGSDPGAVTAALAEATEQVLSQAGPDLGPAIGVGLVMPGVIDAATGSSANPYFPTWAGYPFRTRLRELLGLPVLTDNDANAVALAEARYGAGAGFENLLCLTVGIGIGAGLIMGGRLHRGLRSGAGEIGHSQVDPNGPLCRCGRRGCLEAVASDAAIAERTGLSREEAVAAALRGDRHARSVLAEAGRTIGIAVANAINLISPERVVVGGEAALQAGDLLLAPLREAVQNHTFPVLSELEVLPGALGDSAWVRGAGALVLDQAFRTPLESDDPEPITFATGREEGGAWSVSTAGGRR